MKRTLALAALIFLLPIQPVCASDAAPFYVELADAPTITVDWSKASTQFVTLGGNRTFIFLNGEKGRHYTLAVKQDGTGSHTPKWPAPVHCQANSCPTLTSTAGATDYIGFIYNGDRYDMLAISQNF